MWRGVLSIEISQRGAQTYAQDHNATLVNHVLALESDSGNFDPTGFGFNGCKPAITVMQTIGQQLLSKVGAGNITVGDGADTDNGFLGPAGVPLASLESNGFVGPTPMSQYYFFYHHSMADTFTSLRPDGLRRSVGSFAILSYALADMPTRLPRPPNCTL